MLTTAASLVGAVAWSGDPLTLPDAFAFPALWARSPSRIVTALVSGGYFLAASGGLPQGVASFYSADLARPTLGLRVAGLVAVHGSVTSRPGGGGRRGMGWRRS